MPRLYPQHRERECPVAPLPRGPEVDSERGLEVGGRGNEEVLARRSVLVAAATEGVEAVVPDRARREGEPRIGADELREGREVAVLECLQIAPRDGALVRRLIVRR